jgi:hypothetical protein
MGTEPPPFPSEDEATTTIKRMAADVRGVGAVIALDDPAASAYDGHSVELGPLSLVLVRIERLVKLLRANRNGLEVKRRGRITEVKGAGQLRALLPAAGSYAVPVAIVADDDRLNLPDQADIADVVSLLNTSSFLDLIRVLNSAPERIGDELAGLMETLGNADLALALYAVRDGAVTESATVSAESARKRGDWLLHEAESVPGQESLDGNLFRVDTKRWRIGMDAISDVGEWHVVEAGFPQEQLDALKAGIRRHVRLNVEVVEARRPYERTARTRDRRVTSVEIVGDPLEP